MKNKKNIMIICITGILLGCIVITTYNSVSLYKSKIRLQNEVNELKEKIKVQKNEFTEKANENKKLKEELDIYKADMEEGVEIHNKYEKLIEEKKILLERVKQSEYLKSALRIKEYSKGEVEVFPLYHATGENIDGYNEEEKIGGYMLVDKNLPIKEKMQLIANNISRSYFGLPIEVERIQERDGKKIAIINLVENTVNDMDEWSTKFQGSLGEQFSMSTLENNFIQDQYSGEWVDGIEIQQNHGIRKTGHTGPIPWIVYIDDNYGKHKLEDFLESDEEKNTLEIIDGKLITNTGDVIIQGAVERGNQWIDDNKLTVITRVGFSYYDEITYSGRTIETLTLDLSDGTILKRYIGKGKGLVKEELLYPDSLYK